MKLAVLGAGAIGLSLAAALATRHDVMLFVRRANVAEALTRDGIALAGDDADTLVPVRATVRPGDLADRDAVIVAVKSFATAAALAPLRGILSRDALVASVQNGIDNAAAARGVLPGTRVVAGSTMFGAMRLGDTRVRPVARRATVFERSDDAGATSDDLAAAFLLAGLEARVVDDIGAVLWSKLIVNAAINPLGALADVPNGAIASDPELMPTARGLAREAGAVAAAAGFSFADPWALVEAAARATAANRNSMLQDLEAGRPTEIDEISGAIVRHAAAHGISVPFTADVLRRVRAVAAAR